MRRLGGAVRGQHYHLGRTLNSPQSLRRPHPPILIGGGGEKKTLRLVAQYADACNLFPSPELGHKLDVLRRHCEDLGRDYDAIEKTVMMPLDASDPKALLARLEELRPHGITHVEGIVPHVATITPLETLGREVIPVIADW